MLENFRKFFSQSLQICGHRIASRFVHTEKKLLEKIITHVTCKIPMIVNQIIVKYKFYIGYIVVWCSYSYSVITIQIYFYYTIVTSKSSSLKKFAAVF